MNRAFATLRILAVAATLAATAAIAAPAFAVDRGPIPGDPVIVGHHLGGQNEAYARAAISSSVLLPHFGLLTVGAAGTTITINPARFVKGDIDAIVNKAYEPTSAATYNLPKLLRIDRNAIKAWLATLSTRVNRAAVNSKYTVSTSRKKLLVTKSQTGRTVNLTSGATVVSDAILAAIASNGATQPPVAIPLTVVAPKVTEKNVGKAILVVLSERRLRLYNNSAVAKTYKCAIGQTAYPTPPGTWKIVNKRMNPSWTNPGSAWGKSMPAYIAPGPNNPLGTRALYLNASGIRIHGTNNIASVGTPASHGCMRMVRHDIEELFPLVPVGTAVYIIK